MVSWSWTGGIGDVFVIESHLHDAERADPDAFYWATRAQEHVSPLFGLLPNYPKLSTHTFVHDDFTQRTAFHKVDEVRKHAVRGHLLPPMIVDMSISNLFPLLKPAMFGGSSFLKYPIASVDHLPLPDQFTFIHPYTSHNPMLHRQGREFNDIHWRDCLARLERRSQTGVVVNHGHDPIPNHRRLIDLSNKLTLAEAVEVLKRAEGYCGIDSCFAALACQRFDASRLMILASNPHYFDWLPLYCAPHTTYPFVARRITS